MSKEMMSKTLNEMLSEAKIGAKGGVSALTADKLVDLFHKNFKNQLPNWINNPAFKEFESCIIPGLIYLMSIMVDTKYSDKVSRISLLTFRAKVQDLTKFLWKRFNPLFNDISKLIDKEGL